MSTEYQRNYKPPFKKFVKKAAKPLALVIEDEVEVICENPEIGVLKVGDLAGIRVHKFTHLRQEYLLAYRPPTLEEAQEGAVIEWLGIDFYQVGSHENFYADLKKYLKKR
ncbi:type II toxin-antitoxin system RelE/ParE family toxin [Pseudomonas paracarnis]|uniref:type II toxin-antitoxin system RelE/ParE family toxin n=1 Tax=Pseudomonas paracarnis TaxID=2750625 RepID=UPI00191B0267|nr:type II toxin-antitoxin system RelE/ParE family toxin [Pseudomonas paracarnis]